MEIKRKKNSNGDADCGSGIFRECPGAKFQKRRLLIDIVESAIYKNQVACFDSAQHDLTPLGMTYLDLLDRNSSHPERSRRVTLVPKGLNVFSQLGNVLLGVLTRQFHKFITAVR